MRNRSSMDLPHVDQARLSVADLPPFRPRAPWWGGDLQTLSSYFRRRARLDAYAHERLVLPLGDGSGDRIAATLTHPPAATGRPLAVLIHGLGGSENSFYMCNSAAHLLALGYPVLRLNLRGAGPSRPLCRFQYHGGRTGDFAAALAALPEAVTASGVIAIGYSLGGNMLLKFLGERGAASAAAGGGVGVYRRRSISRSPRGGCCCGGTPFIAPT